MKVKRSILNPFIQKRSYLNDGIISFGATSVDPM